MWHNAACAGAYRLVPSANRDARERIKRGRINSQNMCKMGGIDLLRFVVAHKKGCSEMLDSLLVF